MGSRKTTRQGGKAWGLPARTRHPCQREPRARGRAPKPTLPGGGPSTAPEPGKAACFVPSSPHPFPFPPSFIAVQSLSKPQGREWQGSGKGVAPPALTGRASPRLWAAPSSLPTPPPRVPSLCSCQPRQTISALQHSIKIEKHLG